MRPPSVTCQCYCVGCHSERAKAAGDSARKISLDSIDLANVHPHAEKSNRSFANSARA
jgi:hypothetical protein